MIMNDELLTNSRPSEQHVNVSPDCGQLLDHLKNEKRKLKRNIDDNNEDLRDDFQQMPTTCCSETTQKQLKIRPTSLPLSYSSQMSTAAQPNTPDDVNASLDEGFSLLSCQEKICDLYMHLHEPGSEEMLNLFGSIVLNFIEDMKHLMSEKNHLEILYNKAKDQHSHQVKHLEEELGNERRKVEDHEKEKYEQELTNLAKNHKREMSLLQMEMKKLKETAASARSYAETIAKLMNELEACKKDNEDLKNTVEQLTANLTLMKTELTNFQKKLEEKEVELVRQKKIAFEDSIEIDNLVTQVNLLQSANKTLHEKTDDLCEALRICRSYYKTQIKQKAIMTKDDFIQKYLDESCVNFSRSLSREPQALEVKSIKTSSSGFGDNDDLESCQSIMEDVSEFDNSNSQSDCNSNQDKKYINENCAISSNNQEPERIFKVVLAGDAAVGKSSFIMRLCKNKFVSSLNSTVGVDFQTKTLKVDGKIIALQLWDTAGQERFRSIAKSYFRRADGVLLLYDVSYERSFINVRSWIETIQDGAPKSIPVMIVGNKSDLREDLKLKSSCLRFEDGLHLAKGFESLFVETSAKNGNNINQAIIELSRALMAREDLEVRAVGLNGLKLKDSEIKKGNLCC